MAYEIRRGDITVRVTNDREFQVALAAIASVEVNPGAGSGERGAGGNGSALAQRDPAESQLLEAPTDQLEDRFFQNITNE